MLSAQNTFLSQRTHKKLSFKKWVAFAEQELLRGGSKKVERNIYGCFKGLLRILSKAQIL